MGIEKLNFCEPFYNVRALKDEEEYIINNKSIVINLSEKSNILIKEQPLGYLKSTIVTNIKIKNLCRALIVEDYENNAYQVEKIKKQWSVMFDITKLERHRGINLWRSPKELIFDNIMVNLCYLDSNLCTGAHKTHPSNYKEVHTQLFGYGKMQKFEEDNFNTIYQEVILAPGNTHEPFCDNDGNYPWHQYQSITNCIYMPIEVNL